MSEFHENLSAEQIRAQMDYVRNEIDDDVDQVIEDAGSLGDIRAYVKAQPIGWLIAAAAAGYFLVPAKKNNNGQASETSHSETGPTTAKKSSIAGAAIGLATTLVTRLITRKITQAGMGLFAGQQPDDFTQQSMPSSHSTETGGIQ